MVVSIPGRNLFLWEKLYIKNCGGLVVPYSPLHVMNTHTSHSDT